MPDYNKGDFTQQGVDGFVEGGLHLNEKRCLTAKISTDEDSAGLDSVEINIHDHLNDLDYTITGENLSVGENALPSGNIEITENGGNINVAPYATATVNVSGGGGVTLNYCEITLVNNSASDEDCPVSVINNGLIEKIITVPANSSLTIISPYFYFDADDATVLDIYSSSYVDFALSSAVNCEVEIDFGQLAPIDNTVNSSCTVTFTGINQ